MKKILPLLALLLCGPALAVPDDEVETRYQSCLARMDAAPAEAIGCFESLHQFAHPSVNSLYYLGRLYLATQQAGKAVNALEQALALDPTDRWALQALLDALDADGQDERSLKAAQRAQLAFPEHAGFVAYLVQRYQGLDQLQQAHSMREHLLALVAAGKTDGLVSENLYLRQRLTVGEVDVHGLEYFRPAAGKPRYVFIAQFADGSERRYQTTYRAGMEDAVRKAHGADALPYFFDAFDKRRQYLVSFLAREPVFEELRDLVVSDLRDGKPGAGFSH